MEGARLAISQVNDSGGITLNGRRHAFVLVERRHVLRADAAASAARASINLDHVDLLIGPQLSTAAQAAGAVAEASAVPMISPMSSSPATTAGRRFVFRLAFLDSFQGATLATFALQELHATRAAVLYDVAFPYSSEIARLFSETFERSGGTIVAEETFTSDRSDHFGPQLRRIATSRPDVVLLPNRPGVVATQIVEARTAGIKAILLGSDTWDISTIATMPEADGSFVLHQWHPELPIPRSEAFVRAYEKEYGTIPRSTAAMTYDAVMLAVDAIRRAGSLRGDEIADAIAATGGFQGNAGILRFDGKHDPVRSGVLTAIRNGGHHLLRVIGDEK